MCLIALGWKQHPRYRLAMIANRDELHARPSTPAGPAPDAPHVHGGRDLVSGGGWLQVSTHGRLAAVTNVRDGLSAETTALSRGWLVRDFVRGEADAATAAEALMASAASYGRFNLLMWSDDALAYAGNHPRSSRHLVAPGIHAMSNGAFDARWPKSCRTTRALEAWLAALPAERDATHDTPALEPLFEALHDSSIAPDGNLPDTGVGLAMERKLSPPFIADPVYGTRCSTIVLVGDDHILFAERRFGPAAAPAGDTITRLALAGSHERPS